MRVISLMALISGGLYALGGCSAANEMMELAVRSNVEQPFPWEPCFAGSPQTVYQHLLAVLRDAGGRVVARDDANYFISWSDSAADFVSVRAGTSEGNTGREYGFRERRIVHGSARVRQIGDKSAVYLHSVSRHPINSSVALSNGDYEHRLLGQLVQQMRRLPQDARHQEPAKPAEGVEISACGSDAAGRMR